MRDEVVVERGEPVLPGVADGVYRFFHVFMELDGRDLMEVGVDRRYYPLKFASNEIREHLTDVVFPKGVRGCVGGTITDVLTLHEQIPTRQEHYRPVRLERGKRGEPSQDQHSLRWSRLFPAQRSTLVCRTG